MEQTMNVYAKLSKARLLLQQKKLKKSGKNKFSGFDYFELSDFLPSINEIFNEVGLCSQFYIQEKNSVDEDTGETGGNETAKLFILNVENPNECILFSSPVEKAEMKGATPIQMLGAKHTYMRRYLWLIAMEICENDEIDATSGKQPETAPKQATETTERKASPKQIQILETYYKGENLEKLLRANNIQNLSDLPMAKASELITKARELIQKLKGANA